MILEAPSSRLRALFSLGRMLLPCLVLGIVAFSGDASAAAPADSTASAAAIAETKAILGSVDPDAPPASGAQLALRILVLMTALSLLPALILSVTCFTRIVIVFSFLRQALGIQGMPPNQVMTGMALFLTMFVMAPVGREIHETALTPLMNEQISTAVALERAKAPLVTFMLHHTRNEDLVLFHEISKTPTPASRDEVSFLALAPAYMLGEVRVAFQMGFLVLVPFMVIDLVVSSVLMALGMVMLPPALIALPVKIMVFVLVDGWGLIIGSLARSLETT